MIPKTNNMRALQYVSMNILLSEGIEISEIAWLFDVTEDYLVSLRRAGE